jgi:hypothetical protein
MFPVAREARHSSAELKRWAFPQELMPLIGIAALHNNVEAVLFKGNKQNKSKPYSER